MLLYILNEYSIEVNNILWRNIGITLIEYVCVKIFLVIFMLIARTICFYVKKDLCQNKKKAKSRKLKFILAFTKVKYWPRLKLGLPGMAGKTHAKTKVKFDSKGFPKFKSYYTVKLRRRYFRQTRERHFYIANKILYKNILSNFRLRAKFSSKEIKEFSQGKTPSKYTWHHHQDAGVLELVEYDVHSKTSHIGGYSIWGGK